MGQVLITALKLNWQGWLYSLAAAFIGGGANAVVAAFTASGLDPAKFNFQGGLHNFLAMVGVTFVASGLLSMFFYLKQNPLPPEEKANGNGGGK